jgi:hypothetical protein
MEQGILREIAVPFTGLIPREILPQYVAALAGTSARKLPAAIRAHASPANQTDP